MELAIILIIVIYILNYRGSVNFESLYYDNEELIMFLKEKDYDFLVMAKYGEKVSPNALFRKRLTNTLYVFVVALSFVLINFSFINLMIGIIIVFAVFKSDYSNLKKFYKRHLNQIDQLLPYYLKSIEVLAQHYTIPVAISKSINTAPEVFKVGLRRMIEKIDSGDSSIDPYMQFAQDFPVRDSVRMMRLLYRLSIGAQENKQDQLLVFSKSVSSLQNKSREQMYSRRLKKMESKTLIMLVATGGGTMVIMVIAMMMMLFSV